MNLFFHFRDEQWYNFYVSLNNFLNLFALIHCVAFVAGKKLISLFRPSSIIKVQLTTRNRVREHRIIPLDRWSGPLKIYLTRPLPAVLLRLHRLPCFIYARGPFLHRPFSTPAPYHTKPLLHRPLLRYSGRAIDQVLSPSLSLSPSLPPFSDCVCMCECVWNTKT